MPFRVMPLFVIVSIPRSSISLDALDIDRLAWCSGRDRCLPAFIPFRRYGLEGYGGSVIQM
jgi:hypothetical protein